MQILFFISMLAVAAPALALTPDFSLYMRAGTNSNIKGGGQECVSNAGSWGNEFRLGNECGIYGEFGLGAHLLKSEDGKGPIWRMFSNFAVSYDNRTDFENPSAVPTKTGTTVTDVTLRNQNVWVLRELYTEGGNFDGANYVVWAGKRFYRWGDVHMDDFFPVSMNGPGGGVAGIRSDLGVWSVAVLQNSSSNEINGTGTNVKTEVGTAAKTTLHVRLDEMETARFGKLSYWLTGGVTPQTKDRNSTQDYKAGSGLFFAAKSDATWGEGVSNELGFAAGQGVMSNMASEGELAKNCDVGTDASCAVMSSSRVRAWDSLTVETLKWSIQTAAIYDLYDKGTRADNHVRWGSLGVRPMYWFTDHVSLAFQGGISNVLDESDGHGSRNLMRFTIAPQLSMGKGFYSRPVVRAFYSKTMWNENNRSSAAGTSAYDSNELDSLGFQTEIWF